jgi:hypothetical protein
LEFGAVLLTESEDGTAVLKVLFAEAVLTGWGGSAMGQWQRKRDSHDRGLDFERLECPTKEVGVVDVGDTKLADLRGVER